MERERETETERDRDREREKVHVCLCFDCMSCQLHRVTLGPYQVETSHQTLVKSRSRIYNQPPLPISPSPERQREIMNEWSEKDRET